MCGGVFFYSLTIGSISTLLNNFDVKTAFIEQKLEILYEIKKEHKIDNNLENRIRRSIKVIFLSLIIYI